MGGYGSTRWGWSSRKTQVEECYKLTIFFLKPYLRPWYFGNVTWSRGGRETGNISYRIQGDDQPEQIRLIYTIGPKSPNPVSFDYAVQLTTSALPWGGARYWFVCPAVGCGRRVGCLYLPSGGKYFACRHCYQLAYASNQENHTSLSIFDEMAASMQADYPGITRKDVEALFEDKTTPHFRQLDLERFIRLWQNYDPYQGYLSIGQVCEQSGLDARGICQL